MKRMPPSFAHVKWFEDTSPYPVRPELILSDRTAFFVAAALLSLGALYLLQRVVGTPYWPELGFLRRMAVGAPTLLAVQAAVTLVHAAVQPTLLAPNLGLQLNAVGLTLAAAQLFIAFGFITGIADWVSSLMLVLLGPIAFLLFPPFDVIEQLFWAGIGVVLMVMGRYSLTGAEARPWFRRRNPAWAPRAVASLRVITGVSLIALGLGEKIWNPGLGTAFLENRPSFNVMRSVFGLAWFSDDLFVLLAGTVEASIGVMLISGLLTRVVILGAWLPFNLGIPFLPPQELIGHLPIFGIMYFLLVQGPGIAPGESTEKPTLHGGVHPRERSHPRHQDDSSIAAGPGSSVV